MAKVSNMSQANLFWLLTGEIASVLTSQRLELVAKVSNMLHANLSWLLVGERANHHGLHPDKLKSEGITTTSDKTYR